MTPGPAAISVRIGRIVLVGVEPGDRRVVADALRAGLCEVVAARLESGDQPLTAGPGRRASLRATAGATPADVGQSVGGALAGVLFDEVEGSSR